MSTYRPYRNQLRLPARLSMHRVTKDNQWRLTCRELLSLVARLSSARLPYPFRYVVQIHHDTNLEQVQ